VCSEISIATNIARDSGHCDSMKNASSSSFMDRHPKLGRGSGPLTIGTMRKANLIVEQGSGEIGDTCCRG
jgi:hypothetical protein